MMAACHDLDVESEDVWKEVVMPCVSAASVKMLAAALPVRSSGLSLSIALRTAVRMK